MSYGEEGLLTRYELYEEYTRISLYRGITIPTRSPITASTAKA